MKRRPCALLSLLVAVTLVPIVLTYVTGCDASADIPSTLVDAAVVAAKAPPVGQVPLPGTALPQFVDPLPQLDLTASGTIGLDTLVAGEDEIELHMREFKANVMPTGFVPANGLAYAGTSVFGYINGPAVPAGVRATYLGPVIVATRNVPTQIRFVNNLGVADPTFTNPLASKVYAFVNSTDQTLHWADPLNNEANMGNHMIVPMMPPMPPWDQHYAGPIPAVPHLHGGYVPPTLDGGPDAWFTSDGAHLGHGYYTKGFKGSVASLPTLPDANYPVGAIVFSDNVAQKGYFVNVADAWQPYVSNECVYRYPNQQEAAMIWYHDHLLGGTRINVYCGLAGAYPLIDPALTLPAGMNAVGLNNGTLDLTSVLGPTGANTQALVPLVIQDRMFDVNGELFFPTAAINPEHPFWIPEFLGDTICVNGKVWPFLTVEAKRYRFLVVDGSNARPYELFLTNSKGPGMGPPIWQIGTDGGYMDKPVKLDPALKQKLVVLPGERAEIIVDFTGLQGKTLLLQNTARAPYPGGAPVNGNTTGRILQIRVVPTATGFVDNSYNPATLTPIRTGSQTITPLVNFTAGTLGANVVPVNHRQMTLNEVMGMRMRVGGINYPGGPLEILVNNTKWSGEQTGGGIRPEFLPVTLNGMTTYMSEVPAEGTTEVWEVINLTADTHPMHTHLVQCQILNRQTFNVKNYTAAYAAAFPGSTTIIDPATGLPFAQGVYIPGFGPPLNYSTGNPLALGGNPDITPFLTGLPLPPAANEAGWKDTMQCPPGTVTRFVARFAPQSTPVVPDDPEDLNFSFDPFVLNYGYVWHCHIVDHEDNEMMRPYVVMPAEEADRTYVQGVDY